MIQSSTEKATLHGLSKKEEKKDEPQDTSSALPSKQAARRENT